MSLPFITAICLQYGDVPQLEDSLACFLAQDYEGESEIVILNSFPRQRLHYEHPKVRIVNLENRPPSLADCRNMAIEHARGTHLVVWDSDDAFAPWYLSTIAKHFGDGQWAWLDKQYFLVGWKIKSVVPGSMNSLVFTKDAWKQVGGYHSGLNVGEDRQFVSKITTRTPGKRVTLAPEEIGFFYSWGESNYHISGEGEDQPGRVTSYERVQRALESRVRNKLVLLGDIALKPAMKRDYAAMARAFTTQPVNPPTTPTGSIEKGSVGVVLLGRYGDIVNALPMLRHIAESYAKPHLVVSREFASILDGVSYVEPHPVDLPYDQVLHAIKLAETQFKHVVVAQVWGKGWGQPKLTEAYNKESWRLVGFLNKFNDPTWLPVFDRRNLAREEALCSKLEVFGKPMLLVKLDGGISSPCSECPSLFPLILEHFQEHYNVINVSDVRAERIFDLLTLFSRAAAIVTIDTSIAHLCPATATPYVLLCNPQPWLGTLPRGHCVRRMTYTEALASPGKVMEAITEATMVERKEMAVVELKQPATRKIIHTCERHDNADNRCASAWQSWDVLYSQHGVIPAHLWTYPRDATSIGDKRKLPFLKDVLSFAMDQAADDDLILFTNDDVILHPQICELLLYHGSVYGPCSSHRCDFKRRPPDLKLAPSVIARKGLKHLGRDLFCFPKAWLVEKWDEIGDFILGASEWDLAMAAMVRLHYGISTTRGNITDVIHPAEIERGYVAHIWHDPHWSRRDNVDKAASQKWNRNLFRAWSQKNIPSLKFHPGNII